MKAETFQDALTLLPEDLLQPVDALRRRKRIPWSSILAAAACLCLVIGLSFLYRPHQSSSDRKSEAANMVPDRHPSLQETPMDSENESEHFFDEFNMFLHAPRAVKVVAVHEDAVSVVADPFTLPDGCSVSIAPITLIFDNLPQVPDLKVGQRIHVYYHQEDFDPAQNTIAPYRIELADE